MEYPHTVTFQSYTPGQSDGMGGTTEGTWEDYYTTEAHVQPLSGYKRIVAQQQQTPITTRLYYPYTDTVIKPDMRALWVDRDKELSMKSDPIDQGGMGEVFMVECDE